jgi:DNA protecting protein DprA
MSVIKKILFLTYLTEYNIGEIFKGLAFSNIDDFIEDYLKRNHSRTEPLTDQFVDQVGKQYLERYEEMKYAGIHFIPFDDKNYPESLKRVQQAPPILYVKGRIQRKINVAIVGTREVSAFAEKTVEKIIGGLNSDHGVVSGLALGIDTIAHRLALKNNIYTIAVMPNPLTQVYPRENYRLANQILEQGGALISELAIHINRGKKSFVERNRLQSGISRFVIPVEMAVKSGTMHTVDFCSRQGRYLLVFEPTAEQLKLPQYEGIEFLKTKKSLKRITIREPFNLAALLDEIQQSQNPTLF